MKKTYLTLVVIFSLTSCSVLKKEVEYNKLSAPQVTANAKELVRITNDVVGEYQPCLSPNGEKLLYAIRDDSKIGSKKFSIRLKNNLKTPGFTPLIGDGTDGASWMNNSEDIIFTYWASKPVIVTSNINKLGIKYIGQNAYGDYDNSPKLSPKGDRILLTTKLQGTNSICLVNKDGSDFTVLSDGENPIWHPNGEKIIYSKNSGDYSQLFELSLDSFQSTQITVGEYNSFNGVYSPDGKYIAFISSKDNEFNHLFVMNTSTRGVSQLTGGNSSEIQPFWGIDGFIYFSSNAGAKTPDDTVINPKDLTFSDIWRVKPLIK
ncbi:TolB family protein [Flavobacterium haoranii]|uniref:WD40-like Beta Propeller Repeat n=1 Tax=Flavobacterium haoranii TaxID=683124 RepID=A0A1M6H7H0_9FLAO|nr:PD40 domain-containing protein [Flavobacterium haoranii]SHJ18145.1 WD40-like Beta Propeller Repeat [Flavobacterium haoranii]